MEAGLYNSRDQFEMVVFILMRPYKLPEYRTSVWSYNKLGMYVRM